MSLNVVVLEGHIGRDAETKFTPTGKSVTTFSLATSYKRGGNEQTDWHNIEAWDKEKIADYLKKGKRVAVTGRIQYESWEKDGEKKYKTKIVVNEIDLLSPKDPSAARSEGTTPTGTEDDVPF